MLEETLVFHKTARGLHEIGQRALPPMMRRALILVDGVKSVGDLSPLFRPGEIDLILEKLEASGHVTLDAQEAAPQSSGEDTQPG